MNNYKTPGVYVEEIAKLPASIAPVATAIPAFIGYTQKASSDGDVTQNLLNVPTRISSMNDYITLYGGANPEDFTVTLNDEYNAADAVIARSVSVSFITPTDRYTMYYAMQMYFANGGGPCWICSVGDYGDTVSAGTITPVAGLIGGLGKVATVDEPTLLVFPDAVHIAGYNTVYQAALDQCNALQDRFTIMDVPEGGSGVLADQTAFRGNVSSDYLKYGAAYYPYLKTALSYAYDESVVDITNHIQVGGTTPPAPLAATTLATLKTSDTSAYNLIKAKIQSIPVLLAPAGAMAGVYARVDRNRGVWKAPANVVISNVSGPNIIIDHEQQQNLNVDVTAGKSINAIRNFTGKGTLVWGARTLAGNDNEWRYVNVRRLFIFIEESVEKASEAVVFEPNDANTWLRMKTMIESFLTQQWSAGALAGSTPEAAYFVNVGLGSTMTAQDILEGRMIVEIGIAAVRPAEFIVLRFSHKLQEA